MVFDQLIKLSNLYFKLASDKGYTDTGAGILFVCQEDKTILLELRSKKVTEPNVWCVPGGGVRRQDEDNPDETDLEGAKREAEEELGCLPNNYKLVTKTVSKKDDFTYITYIYELSLKEKKAWTPKIKLDWESSDCKWFKANGLPYNLHYGIAELRDLLEDKGFKFFELPKKNK
jgi:8-oxo-dGTP pyrophosphatase MutT (NUDIX family)